LLASWVVLRMITLSPLRSLTSLSFPLLHLRHQGERTEQRRPPLKHLPKFSLGLLQRPRLSHPPSLTVHLSLPPLLPLLPPLVLHRHFVHNLFLLHLTVIENVNMVQLMLDSEVAGGPLPAYTRIQEFIANVCILPFVNSQFSFLWFASFFPSCFFCPS